VLTGRTQTNGKADYQHVHQFQDGLLLLPLSAWGTDSPPPAEVPVDPKVDVKTPPPDQVEAMDAATFSRRLARLLVDNPPTQADAPALERFAAMGLKAGSFQPGLDLAGALDEGVQAAWPGSRRCGSIRPS
jgi:hypothetical protein